MPYKQNSTFISSYKVIGFCKMKYLILLILFFSSTSVFAQNGLDAAMLDEVSMANNGQLPKQFIENNVFVKAEASTTEAYVGQPILVTYKFYTRLQAQSKVTKMPIFSGCSVQEMTTNDLLPEILQYKGKTFRVHTIRKVQLIPLHTGTIILDSASVENIFTVYDKGVTQKQINQQQAFSHDEVFTLYSKPVFIQVKDVPTNQQSINFTGAIGSFSIAAKLQKNTDTANENNQLKITIVGSGNFASIVCPTITWPIGFTNFEASSNESVNKLSFPNAGEKEFIIPFVATKTGTYTIPSISFCYFDANSNQYKTIATQNIPITILPALENTIDNNKLQKDITNKKYFWIIPAIALIAGFSWWFRFVRKPQPKKLIEQATKRIEDDASVLTPPPHTTIAEHVDLLLLNWNNDEQFFSDAKKIATQLLQQNNSTQQQEKLEHIIVQCNAALYASNKSIDKQLIVDELKNIQAE